MKHDDRCEAQHDISCLADATAIGPAGIESIKARGGDPAARPQPCTCGARCRCDYRALVATARELQTQNANLHAAAVKAAAERRALEAKLCDARSRVAILEADLVNSKAREANAHTATKVYSDRLAALRPLVRAAVEYVHEDPDDEGYEIVMWDQVKTLDPDLIAWAKGGE